jgi:uncharacterized protein with HEPN domain
MNEEKERRHLQYILESINLIEHWTSAGREVLLSDELVQNATLYRLETLTDAVGKLTADLRARHREIPWRDITDFRNRVSHDGTQRIFGKRVGRPRLLGSGHQQLGYGRQGSTI